MNQTDGFQFDVKSLPIRPEGSEGADVVLHARVVTGTGGGPEKTILLSSPFMRDTNYWLAAAYMHPPNDSGFESIQKRAIDWDSPLIGVPDRGALDHRVVRNMLKICKHYGVRIWHGHDYKSNLLGLMLRPFWSMKLVTTVHGWVKHTSKTPLYYTVDRWCLPYYHHVICVSDDLVERVGQLDMSTDRLSLIHNAIDEKAFDRKYASHESEMRKKFGVPKERLVIGAVGRLSPEKAFDNLITATHRLVGEGHDIELWIAGEGDIQDELQKQIDELKLNDRVRLLGFCDDTIALYHAMDVFVLSSLREGLPNVVLEAASMRVPMVSTRVAGVPKMVTDGKEGLLCECGDVDGLTDAMRRVVSDKELRGNLATEGRALIEREYSFQNRMTKIKAIYDQVLGYNEQARKRPA